MLTTPPILISEHTNKRTGLRSRWFTTLAAAVDALAAIPTDRRGIYTLGEPLKTSPSPGIWRVDEKTDLTINTAN